jgi:hypothetical protein
MGAWGVALRIGLLACAAVVMTLTAACAAGAGTGSAAPAAATGNGEPAESCGGSLTFRGQVYHGTTLLTHPPYNRLGQVPADHMHVIGQGMTSACPDPGNGTAPPSPARIAQIDTIDPRIAVAWYPIGTVYVRSKNAIPRSLTSAPWIRWTVLSAGT